MRLGKLIILLLLILSMTEANAQHSAPPVPPEWRTPAEQTDYRETPRYDEIMALHGATVRRGGTKYRDPLSGLWVMTATYLWDRGYCCYSNCRHCPWVDR